MEDEIKVQTLDTFIDNEQSSVKWSLVYAIGLCVIGFAASLLIYWKVTSGITTNTETDTKNLNDSFTLLVSAVPTAVTTFGSVFPFKEYFAKKDRIISCKFLRLAYDSPPVAEEINKRFWILVDKGLS